jgi:uncharacterized delta-60 repeat protein
MPRRPILRLSILDDRITPTAGDLDPSFGFGGIAKIPGAPSASGDSLMAVAVQADQKIVLASSVSNGSINDFAVMRLNADGTLDTSFNGSGGVSGDAFAAAIQADGKIVVAGPRLTGGNLDFGLARYNPDGSLDSTFGTGGQVTTAVGTGNDYADQMAIQPDGKIIVVGPVWNDASGNFGFGVVRYNTDGSLDTSFDGDGRVITDMGGYEEA